MTSRESQDVAASVRRRLEALAKKRNEDFQAILERFVAERFLYRLSVSPFTNKWVLKGALLFWIWTGEMHRSTRDIDLAGYGRLTAPTLATAIRKVCAVRSDDGLTFHANSIRVEEIRATQEYGGYRAKMRVTLGKAEIIAKVDVGIGDAIVPPPEPVQYPGLLDFRAPILYCYPREAVTAEKLHAMVVLDMINSRMKDFHDLYTISMQFSIEGARLVAAIKATFERRATIIVKPPPIALTRAFYESPEKIRQWEAFVRRSGVDDQLTLSEVCSQILRFVEPPMTAAAGAATISLNWDPGRGWT
jgi:hypothetical protein